MGKKKQAQRTKNNVVPASSGRSAQLLQSTPGVPFVGFSTLKEGGFIPILSGISDELDVNINEDFRLVWKKMNKKDTTTKLKALDEFKKLCQESEVGTIKSVLPYWPRLFSTLSTDQEHRVREAAHAAHRALVAKAGRNIAPFLKQLVGPWFTGQHDTYAPAASTAESSFQETFPPNKLVEAIIFCQEEILDYICNNLLTQTPQTLANNQNCSQETKDARYQRVVVSCLNGYALYLQRLPTEHLHKAEEANRKLVSSAKFWKFNKDPAPIVRAAWFTALVALCEKAPFFLADETKHVCMAVFTNLDETDPSVTRSVWTAALLTFNVVQDVWQHVSLEKLVLPKLWKVLKEGADGNTSLVYPNLLPFLSKLPDSLLHDKQKFHSKFFDSLRTGLKVRNVQISAKETSATITAFLECVRHLIKLNSEHQDVCLALFEEQVFPLVEAVMSDSKLHLARSCLFCSLANLINVWSHQSPTPPYSTIVTAYWGQLTDMCRATVANHITDAPTLTSNCAALNTLLTALRNPDTRPRKSFKVKFSSQSIEDEAEEPPSLTVDDSTLAPAFVEKRNQFVRDQLSLCLDHLGRCSERSRAVLVDHLVHAVEGYSDAVFHHLLASSQLTWAQFYRRQLGQWLREDNIPLDSSLRIVFALLDHVEDKHDVQMVFSDLSGDELLSVPSEVGEPTLEPLYDLRWQRVLEWALRPEHQTGCVLRWLQSHGGVSRLAAQLHRNHPSYTILHNCLRNLRQNSWLMSESLEVLVKSLRNNLSDMSVSVEVKECSADLVHAMLQNAANHTALAQLPTEDLRSLLYELFTAQLQQRDHYPLCWEYCITILSLKSDSNLTLAAVCETLVDLMVAVVRTREMNLAESQKLVSLLETVVQATGGQVECVLNRLVSGLRQDAELVWGLYSLAETVVGSVRETRLRQFVSHMPKDPLGALPLQQYVTSMIPVMMMVVRLQTAAEAEDNKEFPYAQLRADLPADQLWDWTLHVLHLHSLCISIKTHFHSTKQFFILKEKITFILEECGLFSQLRVKDLVRHIDLSTLEEGNATLECDLSRLQKQTVIKDLGLLYNTHNIQRDLFLYKSKSLLLRCYFFPEDVLEELASTEVLERSQLSTVNICQQRLAVLKSQTTHITILDGVFDLFVAAQKENRSLLNLSDEELHHIAEVVDFATRSVTEDSAHMKQSSWDACLVATAALTHSISTTLVEWTAQRRVPAPPQTPDSPATSEPWPLSLLCETTTTVQVEDATSLCVPLVRVVCSVCRLFDAVSSYMNVPLSDKAAETRCVEWREVFLPGSHAAITQAWLSVAEVPCDCPAMVMLVGMLSASVAKFVQYPHFINGQDPLHSLDTCCRLLQSSESSVQLTAYHLLTKLIPAMVELDVKQCEKDSVALSCQHVDQTLVYTQSIIDIILSGLSFGDMCIVEPFTDSYTYVRCYLLLWCSLLEMCSQACSQLRALYTTWLKEEYLRVLMKTVFCLMPEAALHSEVTSQRIAQYFSKPPQFDKAVWGSECLAQLSCWVYACGLRRLPAAIRQWWHESEHRIYSLVEHVTATYVSPDLCAEEMRAIQMQENKFDNMTVHVHPTAKEVYAVYTVEESHMDLVIELAHNHPLGLVKVRSGQRMVSNTQTRQWLLQITIFLTHQNGSIWDALELWKTSLDKRFEGVEECYICFAVLHSVSHQLPKLSCQTCRKKFHSHCLYKWFTTSNKSTCPICRNLF